MFSHMKSILILAMSLALLLPASAQVKRAERKSLLDRDPDVVHLAEHVKKPIELTVVKVAPVFFDKNGKNRTGDLAADQVVILELMTDKAYKVRGKGLKNDVYGWVGPQAFTSKDPNFVENLKKLHERQLKVQELIEMRQLAIGMTAEEVSKARGTPSKTQVRQSDRGRSERWEFIKYENVSHFTTVRDPLTGRLFRQLSHITKEEREKTVVDFENGVVASFEESKQKPGSHVRAIIPPVICNW
jgi:hypothetical protein